MGKLKNPRHEAFARFYEELESARSGSAIEIGRQAYVLAGNTPDRANHNRLLRYPDIRQRIDELRKEREQRARAAIMPLPSVLSALRDRGFERIEDFFERDAAGIQRVRDLKVIPVEVSIALLQLLRDGMSIRPGLL